MARFTFILTSLLAAAPLFGADDAGALWSGGVQALLDQHCVKCHGPLKRKSKLELDTVEAVLKGNEDGAVVVPGKPDESRLIAAFVADADPHMPPKKQLTDAQIKSVRDWIKSGLMWDEAALAEEDTVEPVQLAALPSAYQPVFALALSPDGKKLAAGHGGPLIRPLCPRARGHRP